MLTYAFRRIVATVPVLVVATFIVFVLVSVANDPLARLATCVNCDQGAYDRLVDLYDLDQPVPVRFLGWIGGALTGDLGVSTSLGQQPVGPILLERAGNTALLAVPAFVVIAVIALVLSVLSSVRQYSVGDYVITGGSFLGISMPTFFFGLLLQVAFGVWWQDWTGTKPFYVTGMHLDGFADYVASAMLPIATLALVIVATESRYGRASMLEVINADYIRMARSKGLAERSVIFRHALRNAMIPIVTLWALDFSALLSGSVITETIFAWPGLGQLLVSSISAQDLDLVMGIVMFIAVVTIGFNLLADLLYGVLDPRVRYD